MTDNKPTRLDPDLMALGFRVVGQLVEAGVRQFPAVADALAREVGHEAFGKLRPYLASFYEGVRAWPGADWTEDMSPREDVETWYKTQGRLGEELVADTPLAQELSLLITEQEKVKSAWLPWADVSSFFTEYGCVTASGHEQSWYREAWDAMGGSDLRNLPTDGETEAEALVKLHAISLAVMYLGIYQAAYDSELNGYFSEHPPVSYYIESVGIDFDLLAKLARSEGYLPDSDDEEASEDDEYHAGIDFAKDAISEACPAIFRVIESHFGGDIGLFAAIWNSRLDPQEQESLDMAVNSTYPGEGKVEVWGYVSRGMVGWSW